MALAARSRFSPCLAPSVYVPQYAIAAGETAMTDQLETHGAEETFWNPEAHVVVCLACDADIVV